MAVSNMTCTCSLNCTLDLRFIHECYPHSVYDPKKFNGLRFKINEISNAKALLFTKGNIVLTGLKSLEETYQAARSLDAQLCLIGYDTHVTNIQIRNIVYSNKFDCRIPMERFCKDTPRATYEMELFPGGLYTYENSRVKAVFFHNGKYYLCGLKSLNECVEKDAEFRRVVLNFLANIRPQ